jgi:hypothetical protein
LADDPNPGIGRSDEPVVFTTPNLMYQSISHAVQAIESYLLRLPNQLGKIIIKT